MHGPARKFASINQWIHGSRDVTYRCKFGWVSSLDLFLSRRLCDHFFALFGFCSAMVLFFCAVVFGHWKIFLLSGEFLFYTFTLKKGDILMMLYSQIHVIRHKFTLCKILIIIVWVLISSNKSHIYVNGHS